MKNNGQKQLTEKVDQILALLKEAENIADKYSLDFNLNLAYGMGGTYYGRPKPLSRKEAIERLASPQPLDEEEIEQLREVLQNTHADEDEFAWESSDEYGWRASSQSC